MYLEISLGNGTRIVKCKTEEEGIDQVLQGPWKYTSKDTVVALGCTRGHEKTYDIRRVKKRDFNRQRFLSGEIDALGQTNEERWRL